MTTDKYADIIPRMSNKKTKMSDRIRAEISHSAVSRYRIAQDTGIEESTLSRFISGERGLSMEALDTLFEYFGLDVVRRGRKRP